MGASYLSSTPEATMTPQMESLVPRWWTKKRSDTVLVTSVSSGAEAMPCSTLHSANDVKVWLSPLARAMRILEASQQTVAKNPQTLLPSSIAVEMTKKGRLPHTLAPDAVKKVVKPVQNCRRPIIKVETMSRLTLYCCERMTTPGVIMGPSETVTPELKAKTMMIVFFQKRDQLRGSFGLSLGCGCSTMLPSFLRSLLSTPVAAAQVVSCCCSQWASTFRLTFGFARAQLDGARRHEHLLVLKNAPRHLGDSEDLLWLSKEPERRPATKHGRERTGSRSAQSRVRPNSAI